ncbi:hypothetical protein C8R43DRAFT_76341 [Mycena crocata]|nr:hypothetical protein C8R43DRAFT_76341 [Mycena crocata]
MYFHIATSHRHSRVPLATQFDSCRDSMHMRQLCRRTAPTLDAIRFPELHKDSVVLPRPSRGSAGAVYFQLPRNGNTHYVRSWPPTIASVPSSASSTSSDSSSASVYYTPVTSPARSPNASTVSTPSTDDSISIASTDLDDRSHFTRENFAPLQSGDVLAKQSHAGHKSTILRREPKLQGFARLRPHAPPPIQIKQEANENRLNIVVEIGDEKSPVKPHAWRAFVRREKTSEESRRILINLILYGRLPVSMR